MAYYSYERVKDHVPINEFHQAQSAELPVAMRSYDDALQWWKLRSGKEWIGSNDRPVAKRDWSNRRMRMRADKSIEFEIDGHVLCVWHPDKTLTVDPYQTYKTAAFDRFVMPRTIEVGQGARSGKVVYLKPSDVRVFQKITLETDTGVKRMSNPDILVVRADQPVNLRKIPGTEQWEPANEFKVKPFYWYELNRSELREASLKYNFPEFIAAIQAALSMGAEIKTSTSHTTMNARTNADGKDILTLLEEGDFVGAAGLVRPAENRYYDPATGKYVVETLGLSSTDIKKMRHMAYNELGLLYLESERCVSLPQFNNIEVKLRDFGTPPEK